MLWQYIKSVFVKRWSWIIPFPSAVLGAIQWTSLWLETPPSNIRDFQPWTPPAWAWVCSVALGICIAQVLAWREQWLKTEGLSGQPGVTLECTSAPGGTGRIHKFMLANTNEYPATNISALPIEIQVPERLHKSHAGLRDRFNIAEAPTETWTIKFGSVPHLANGEPRELSYDIEGVGSMQRRDIGYVLMEGDGVECNGYVRIPGHADQHSGLMAITIPG